MRERITALWEQLRRLAESRRTVLVVTCSSSVQLDLQILSIRERWRIRFARTVDGAVRLQRANGIPLVLYDGELPGAGWPRAFSILRAGAQPPLLCLLSPTVDRRLWKSVLDNGGFDVIEIPVRCERLAPFVNGALDLVEQIESSAVEAV